MKSKFITLGLSLVFLAFFSTSSFAVNTPTNLDPSNSIEFTQLYGVSFDHNKSITLGDIKNLSRKEIEHKLNTKLNFKQKMALKFSKYRIKRLQKKGADLTTAFPADSGGFHFLAFVLGFFFFLLGALISWILWGKRGLRSSLYGSIFWLVLVLLGFRIRR